MIGRATILMAVLLLSTAVPAADIRSEIEQQVRRELREAGGCCGYDADADAYTVVVSAVRRCPTMHAFTATRMTCFRLAELRGRHEIMEALSMTVTGATSVVRAGKRKTVSTVLETFSSRSQEGFEIVAFHEKHVKDDYGVAMALRWSRSRERKEISSLAGAVVPSVNWIDEFRRFVDSKPWTLLPPLMTFADSSGYVHHLGIGMAESSGTEAAFRERDMDAADLQARKNLQLCIQGSASVRKQAGALLKKGIDPGVSSQYEALAGVTASGELPAGTSELYARKMRNPFGDGDIYMSVYAVMPSLQKADPVRGKTLPDKTDENARASERGVCVFNPQTGKFEPGDGGVK